MKNLRINAVLLIFLIAPLFFALSNAGASSAGKIIINSSPESARVFINGEFFGRTPFKTRLYPGTYDLRLEKDGYQAYRTTFDIPYKKRVIISHRFEKLHLYGKLKIRSYPPGAQIYIDDKYYGATPESIRLREGQYHVRLEKKNFKPYVQMVNISPDERVDMEAELLPMHQYGIVKITSNPSGARVMINGSYFEKTPMEVKLRAGIHNIKLIKKGFKPLITKMDVRAGQVNRKSYGLTKEPPPIREGRIKFYSNPSDAMVFINNRQVGKTPMKSVLKEDSYTIQIEKKGYKTFKKQIHITPGKTLYVNADLEKKTTHHEYGMLHISTHPRGGKVMVNGNYYGVSPLSVRLTPGTHLIRIKRRGFQTYEQKIRIRPHSEQYVNADLVRLIPEYNSNGTVHIVSKPLGSKVFINGDYKGETPLDVDLPSDIYTLEVRHKGFHTYKNQINIYPGKTLNVKVVLDWTGYKKNPGSTIQVVDEPVSRVKP